MAPLNPARTKTGEKTVRQLSGAYGETAVILDMTRRGWSVFVPVGGTHGCDLVAVKGSRVLRVEVKSVAAWRVGFLSARNQRLLFDVAAIVVDGKTTYFSSENCVLLAEKGVTEADAVARIYSEI